MLLTIIVCVSNLSCVGEENTTFDAIFCANLLAYLIPSNVWFNCEASACDGYSK